MCFANCIVVYGLEKLMDVKEKYQGELSAIAQ